MISEGVWDGILIGKRVLVVLGKSSRKCLILDL